ncbi:MAG: GNAT family N-acetyltransferase [Acidimicrobiaceae bacterium]|nr:GNAT family N-acetyltransferase [Acidimicrobiaceae bacterium]
MDKFTLRSLADDDADWITRACQDDEIKRWTLVPRPYTRDHAIEFIVNHGNEYAVWVIEAFETSAPVGVISIHNISETSGVASIGYWIAPWFRRRGAACASLELVVAYSQTIVGVTACHANIAITNIASRKTVERAGFVELKNLDQTCPDGDDLVAAIVYARAIR